MAFNRALMDVGGTLCGGRVGSRLVGVRSHLVGDPIGRPSGAAWASITDERTTRLASKCTQSINMSGFNGFCLHFPFVYVFREQNRSFAGSMTNFRLSQCHRENKKPPQFNPSLTTVLLNSRLLAKRNWDSRCRNIPDVVDQTRRFFSSSSLFAFHIFDDSCRRRGEAVEIMTVTSKA